MLVEGADRVQVKQSPRRMVNKITIKPSTRITFGPELGPAAVLGHGAVELRRRPLQRLLWLRLERDRRRRQCLCAAMRVEANSQDAKGSCGRISPDIANQLVVACRRRAQPVQLPSEH